MMKKTFLNTDRMMRTNVPRMFRFEKSERGKKKKQLDFDRTKYLAWLHHFFLAESCSSELKLHGGLLGGHARNENSTWR